MKMNILDKRLWHPLPKGRNKREKEIYKREAKPLQDGG